MKCSMDKLPLKKSDCGKISPLDSFLNFIRLGEFAYAFPDKIRSPSLNDSVQSIHSAYEVQENLNHSRPNETVLELDSPDYTKPESLDSESSSSFDGASSTSGSFSLPSSETSSFSLPPSENQMLLCDLLKRVSTSNESIVSACFDKLNSSRSTDIKKYDGQSRRPSGDPKVPETPPHIPNFMKTVSFDDHEIAQVVHDLVFEKYEESYVRLLNKLKKLHLSEEENRFRTVVVELENIIKKKKENRPYSEIEEEGSAPDRVETCSVNRNLLENATTCLDIQRKTFEGVKLVYSSTDSELELEVKPVGIPQSGKLDKSFTKTTPNAVNMEPFDRAAFDLGVKNSSPNDFKLPSKECSTGIKNGTKDLQKYLSVPDVIQNSPFFNQEAQVYAFNVEDRHPTGEGRHQRLLEKRKTYNKSLDHHDDIINIDQIEERPNNSLCPSASPMVHSVTNQSHMSDNVEYDEYNFLKAALGDELLEDASSNEYIFPHTVSIGTDDISELLSSTSSVAQSRRRRCRNRKSTETISTFDKKSVSPCNTVLHKTSSIYQKSSTISGSFVSYETITNFSQSTSNNHQDQKMIKNKIFVHETIIAQVERALEYGRRKSRGFIGSPAHLEAERTLLVSKIRRQALINTLYTIQDTTNDTHGRITIENLRCTLNTITNNHHLSEQHYICILQNKTTVYSTKIATPNRLGWIDFGGCFIFDVTNTFNIKIELHCIQVSQGPQSCFVLPFMRPASRLPMIKLIGETYIGIMNRKSEKFSLLYRDGERFREHKITASIQTSIKWPEPLRGFLTIGIEKHEHQPIWNRRWCVLEHGKLKYYNYPSDENYCKPVGIVDMETCKCCDETYRKYLRQKTLALFVDSGNEYKIYYLSPDSTEEFEVWRQNIDAVLKLIKEWNMF